VTGTGSWLLMAEARTVIFPSFAFLSFFLFRLLLDKDTDQDPI
jgi:hypothetical protein